MPGTVSSPLPSGASAPFSSPSTLSFPIITTLRVGPRGGASSLGRSWVYPGKSLGFQPAVYTNHSHRWVFSPGSLLLSRTKVDDDCPGFLTRLFSSSQRPGTHSRSSCTSTRARTPLWSQSPPSSTSPCSPCACCPSTLCFGRATGSRAMRTRRGLAASRQ